MPRINEIKDQKTVVQTVGNFANSLQQIAAMRMVKLRNTVLASHRFVEEATLILRELHVERLKQLERDLTHQKIKVHKSKKPKKSVNPKTAIIVVTSNQGLCGSYHTEIFQKLDEVSKTYPQADYFVSGKKGQQYALSLSQKLKLNYFPYDISDAVGLEELRPLIGMFYYYDQIFLLYSHYLNTTTRKVIFMELTVPNLHEVQAEVEKEEGKYLFEPGIDELIAQINSRIRYALFRQQLLDSKLSLYTAQMVAMKTASDNAKDLLEDLNLEYNKARRKLVDKKINEVQAGRSLWATDTN